MKVVAAQRGYSLVELLVSLAVAAMLLQGLSTLLNNGWSASELAHSRGGLVRDTRFAMARMVDAVAESERLLVPQADIPFTSFYENVREQTVPASPPQGSSSLASAVLAVTLGRTRDLDLNGVPDADNDGDGLFDEDLPADTTNDGEPGLRGFDDDGGGITDFNSAPAGDDDESVTRVQSEDPFNGLDDDGDGAIDEDPGADNNGDGAPGVAGVDDDGDGSVDEGNAADDDEDGSVDEDWYDPVVFYLQTDGALIERRAVPWDEDRDGQINGRDFIESTLAEGVTRLRFERVAGAAGLPQLVDITLTLADANGEPFELNTQVRVGGTR